MAYNKTKAVIIKFFYKANPFAVHNTKILKGFISIYPAVAAVCLAFFKDVIVTNTSNVGNYIRKIQGTESYTPDVLVSVYWCLLTLWIISYFVFVTNESNANKNNINVLRSAIFRSPNPKIFGEYEVFYKEIMWQLNLIKTDDIAIFSIRFNKILKTISDLANDYMNRDRLKVIYGANIMLYLPRELNKDLLVKLKTREKEWFHFRRYNIDNISGALYLVPELVLRRDTEEDELFSPITLPVVYAKNKSDIEKLNIPGAPKAAQLGRFIYADLTDFTAYHHLGADEVAIAKNYWEENLPTVKSMISLGIPYIWGDEEHSDQSRIDIIGVLNIDSTSSYILGVEPEYHTTFAALIYPILCQLGPYLKRFYSLYIKELELRYP